MKCSSCKETWHQLPDPDELLAEIEMQESGEMPRIDDIPDAVKPIPEGSSVPALHRDSDEEPEDTKGKYAPILLGLVLAIVLAMPLILFKTTIMSSWPESIAFYNALGMAGDVPGEGVVFDQMRGDIKDDTFILTGQVINLTSHSASLPLIEVSLKDSKGNVASTHYIRMPKAKLNAEEILPIKAEYKITPDHAIHDAMIRFVLKAHHSKTASADGDNTQSPHADDHAPPHGDAKSAKSPAHGDAPPHQESSHSNSDHH